jgi:hypothetical protein
MKFCPCCKKLRFCFELEVMPSKIAELNDLANQCQQDIDMESTHLEPLKVKADKWSEAVNKAYYKFCSKPFTGDLANGMQIQNGDAMYQNGR